MPFKMKFPVALIAALVLAVAVAPAIASGLTIKTTPSRAKAGSKVKMLVTGLKANEKVKGVEKRPFPYSDTKTYSFRAGHGGSLLVVVTAQTKGKHTWTFTGRTSHRSGTTRYYVK